MVKKDTLKGTAIIKGCPIEGEGDAGLPLIHPPLLRTPALLPMTEEEGEREVAHIQDIPEEAKAQVKAGAQNIAKVPVLVLEKNIPDLPQASILKMIVKVTVNHHQFPKIITPIKVIIPKIIVKIQ